MISAMGVFNFDDGMVAESWYAWLAFRSRVSMSAIGSVIVMACGASLAAVPHALGLGDLARGLSAISGAVGGARLLTYWCSTSWTCARPGAPRRGPSPARRSGTS